MTLHPKRFLLHLRRAVSEAKLADSRSENFFITTPIFYVNSKPHIGHAYTVVIADILARWQQILNVKKSCFLSVGTDEHGPKVLSAAQKVATSAPDFTRRQVEAFRQLFDALNVNYSYFTRTSDSTHRESVAEFWDILDKNGYIYKGHYEGWYCQSDEEFLSEKDTKLVKVDGTSKRVSASSGNTVEQLSEENYMFRLTAMKDRILENLQSKQFIRPDKFRRELLLAYEKSGIADRDLSVSRPVDRCSWGIRVPNDEGHVIYVWLDALVNYLTACRGRVVDNFWPADAQIVGKDILKFHAVYWPAFLMAADMDVPKNIICHSHWLFGGEKMSKSKGNVVDPFKYLRGMSSDFLRLYMVSSGNLIKDNNFSHDLFCSTANNLVNCLGNALNRVMTSSNLELLENTYPTPNEEALGKLRREHGYLFERTEASIEQVRLHFKNLELHLIPECILLFVQSLNKFLNDTKFWKCDDDVEKIAVFYATFEVLRVAAILFWPIIPLTSTELLERLSVAPRECCFHFCKLYLSEEALPPWAGRSLRPDSVPLLRHPEFAQM